MVWLGEVSCGFLLSGSPRGHQPQRPVIKVSHKAGSGGPGASLYIPGPKQVVQRAGGQLQAMRLHNGLPQGVDNHCLANTYLKRD